MPKGFMGGMPNMNNLMKQAQKLQKQMADKQKELEDRSIEVSAGGGAVKIVINGKKEIKSIKLSDDVVDRDDIEMLEDLIITAVNEGIRQADELHSKEISKLTGGMPTGLF